MNASSPESCRPDSVGEQNTQRLLAHAYHPELPDAAFAQQVKAAMLAVRTPITYPAFRQRNLRTLMVAAAAFIVLGVGVVLSLNAPQQPSYRREGTAIVIDGHRYEPAPTDGTPLGERPAIPPAIAGLTARPAASRPAVELAQVGQTIRTQTGQRRRVGLADGSILYINQNTALTIDAPRRLSLASGEVYLEVSPRQKVPPVPSPAPGAAPQPSAKDPTFLVKTPRRQVSALGTHFDVKANNLDTTVLVTQGVVDVDGTDVYAGEELPATGTPAQAPRATFILDWLRDLIAAANTPLVPDSDYQGGALIAIDPWGQESRLTLRNLTIDVYIEDGFARTTIDQTYFNNDNWRMEGTFYFPLPADASLSRLAMYVDGTLMEGGMCERDEARATYESIVYQRKDPALLEWVDGTTFKMRVFPLEARQEKRIILSYTQKLDDLYGKTQYRFPAGHTMNLVRDWTFHALVKNGAGMPWAGGGSGSDALTAKTAGQDLVLDASAHQVKPDQDVTVNLGAGPGTVLNTGKSTFATNTYEGQRYIMLRYRPALEGKAQHQRRDWVFLFESSGARDPLLARTQVDIVKTMLDNVEHDDTFAIVTAGAHASAMTTAPLAATPENVAQAVAYLEKTHLIGALDLGQALDATAPFVQGAANPYLVHLGTGQSVLNERAADKLVARIPAGAHYVGIGVGKNWSRAFMKAAAAATGGYFTQINPDEPVQWRAFDLVSTLNTPRLLDVRVSDPDAGGGKTPFLAFEDSLAQGEELAAIARYSANDKLPGQVLITGTLDGKPYRHMLAVDAPTDNAGYLPRMWAKLEIDRLLAENSESNKPAIIALSKLMYVMSPYTSLLVLENEAMYAQYHVDRGRKDHWAMYPAPEKIALVYEPDPLHPGALALAAGQRQPAQQVLSTLLIRQPAQPLYWPNDPGYNRGGTLSAWDYYNGADLVNDGAMDGDRFWGFTRDRSGRWESGDMHMAKWAGNNGLLAPMSESLTLRQATLSRSGNFELAKQRLASSSSLGWNLKQSQVGQAIAGGFIDSMRRKGDFVGGHLSARPSLEEKGLTAFKYSRDDNSFFSDRKVAGYNIRTTRHAVLALRKDEDGKRLSFDSYFDSGIYNNSYPTLTYQRPYYSQDWRVFGDLLQYAPGMNTLPADIQTTLESEAVADAASAPGTIDAQARALIDQARPTNWHTAAIAAEPRAGAFTLTFDGQGRYRYERIVSEGLHETVICDGMFLWHLYPEIGVGAKRTVSRFHQDLLAAMVPWVLPSADDLARGSNVTLIAPRTVAIVPLDADTRKDADGKLVPYVRLELAFADDGRLAQRRWVELPTGKLLGRETYSASGLVIAYDEQDKETQRLDLTLKSASVPDLTPATAGLVLLPVPYRDRGQIISAKALTDDGKYNWSEDAALAVAAADISTSNSDLLALIGTRFFAKGDHRIGFYTLMMASNCYFAPGSSDPTAIYPGNPLARFYTDQRIIFTQGVNNADLMTGDISKPDFIQRMAAIRSVMSRLQRGDSTRLSNSAALEIARACKDPYFGWAILGMSLNYGNRDENFYATLATTAKTFENVPGLNYAARYEQASALYNAGQTASHKQSGDLFKALYAETLATDSLPLIDYTFRNALSDNNNEAWLALMRDTGATLRSKYGPSAAIYHAWQLYQIGDQALGEELFAAAMADASPDQRIPAILTGVDFLRNNGQYPRAARLLEPLLADPKCNQSPSLLMLASELSYNRGMVAQGLTYQEKAMDIEYANLPAIINLDAFRNEYGTAMGQYLTLANAMATMHQTGNSTADLIAKVVRTADRWRAIDPDKTASCQTAAETLMALNVPELAWDYMTTPLAEKSNEGQPWVNLAQQLRQQGNFPLADRAYATAFEVEPTNAQILWDRAMLLQQQERFADAKKLFQQISQGKWEPRFSWLQSQATKYVQSH